MEYLFCGISVLIGFLLGGLFTAIVLNKSSDGVITVDLENESIAALEIYTPIDKVVSNDKIMLTVRKLEQK